MEPQITDAMIKQLTAHTEALISKRLEPVLVCSSSIRSPLKNLIERVLPQLNVISVNEVPNNINVQTAGVVYMQEKVSA